jgi:hypothetical protein
VLLPELEFDRVMVAPDTARADGVELWLNWHPGGPWSGWLSYTWSQVQDRIDGVDEYRSWDQRHAASFGIAWSKGPWSATLANSFHTGWPTTQLSLASASTTTTSPVVIGPRNAIRFDDYDSLDLRVTRTQSQHRTLAATRAIDRRAVAVWEEMRRCLILTSFIRLLLCGNPYFRLQSPSFSFSSFSSSRSSATSSSRRWMRSDCGAGRGSAE